MVARVVPSGQSHQTGGAFYDYTKNERTALTSDERCPLRSMRDSKLVLMGDAPGLTDWAVWNLGIDRCKGTQGFNVSLSVPDTVLYAWKHLKLLESPEAMRSMYDRLRPHAHAAMQELNKFLVGRSTGGKHVKVDGYFLESVAGQTRDRRLEMGFDNYVYARGQSAADGRTLKIHEWVALQAQSAMQARWSLGIGQVCREEGVVVLPKEKSVEAAGFACQSPGAARIAATGAQSAGAKTAAAIKTRPPKEPFNFKEAYDRLTGTAGKMADFFLKNLIRSVDVKAQEVWAGWGTRKSIHHHVVSGAARFTKSDLKLGASQLALGVEPAVFERVFERVMAEPPQKHGLTVVREYGTGGNVMYAPSRAMGVEHRVARRLDAAQQYGRGGLGRDELSKALAGLGLAQPDYVAARQVAGEGGVAFSDDARAVAVAAVAHRRAGREVHVVGEGGLSLAGFLNATNRTSHLRSLILGFKAHGIFNVKEALDTATLIRTAPRKVRVKKGDLIVLAPSDLGQAERVDAIVKMAQKKKCKVVMTGEGMKPYRELTQAYAQTQRQTIKLGAGIS